MTKNRADLCLVLAAALALMVLAPDFSLAQNLKVGNRVLARALDIELGNTKPAKYEHPISSGAMQSLLEATGAIGKRAQAVGPETSILSPLEGALFSFGTKGCQNVFSGPDGKKNIRVNQDCSLRRQAEEVVVVNPTDPLNLIAGQNDSRIGFNHCGYDFSFDGGKTWGDQIPPFYQFIMADGHTADACSDPTATFDAAGNAYIAGVLFDITSPASALVVAKSNAGNGGAFYHSPKNDPFQTYLNTPLGVVASDNDPNIVHDKEFIVADAGGGSPKKNNVYATWTRFNAATGAGVGANSPIFFSQSTDGGATWSSGVEISGANAAICTAFSGEANANACDQNQGSHPVVAPDGTIYVAFLNSNVPGAGVGQHLVVKCPANKDCSSAANWSAPVKISDDTGDQPVGPVAATGCPAFRACLPPNGYRVSDDTFGSLSVDNNGVVYHVFSDFRNASANCTGSAATATPPCNQDVFYSYSTNGGATWSSIVNVTPAAKFGQTAQWMPWSAVAPNGKTLWVAFYDRSYGNCEFDGCNDITLAKINNPASGSPKISYARVTTSSMPNLVVANNPVEAGFLGDYMWVSVDGKGNPYVVWADARGTGDGNVEEDVYYTRGCSTLFGTVILDPGFCQAAGL